MASFTATTTPKDTFHEEGRRISFLMEDATTIYKGDLVRINADGYAVSREDAAVGDMFAGMACETVVNAGAVGAKSILVDTEGVFQVFKATAAITDIGSHAVCSTGGTADPQTVTCAAAAYTAVGIPGNTDAVVVGTVVGRVLDPLTKVADATRLWVKLLSLQQIKLS